MVMMEIPPPYICTLLQMSGIIGAGCELAQGMAVVWQCRGHQSAETVK